METKIVIVGIYVHPNTISTAYIYETIEAPTVNRYTYLHAYVMMVAQETKGQGFCIGQYVIK